MKRKSEFQKILLKNSKLNYHLSVLLLNENIPNMSKSHQLEFVVIFYIFRENRFYTKKSIGVSYI
jgi:hypothetical protein